MMRNSVNNNTRMGLVISLCSHSNHCISKTTPVLEIEDLVFMLRSIERRAFFYSPGNCCARAFWMTVTLLVPLSSLTMLKSTNLEFQRFIRKLVLSFETLN